MQPRFVPLTDVAEMLSISASQAYALVRTGELRAIKVGGRGQWRVEKDELERFIQQKYAEARGTAAAELPADELPADAPSAATDGADSRG